MTPLRSTCRAWAWAWCLVVFILGQKLALVVGQSGNCTSGFASTSDWQDEDAQFYLAVQPGSQFGYQVIIPGMQFNCHGFIRSWGALTTLDYRFIEPLTLVHRMYFQLWRPTGDGTYKHVDDDYLEFNPQELSVVYRPMPNPEPNIGFFRFSGKVGQGENRMYFQPGDVVGYFAPHFDGTNKVPLSVTFSNASSGVYAASLVVDMYSVSSRRQLCDMSECGDMVNLHSGVVPHISVQYEVIQPNTTTPDPMTSSCSSTSFVDCRVPTTTTTATESLPLPTSVPTPSVNCTYDCIIPIPDITLTLLTALVPAGFAVLLLIILGIAALCVTQNKRIKRSLVTLRRSETYQNTQTYSSPDDFIQLNQPVPKEVQHYPAKNGALYALSNRANLQAADSNDAIDGSCYATSYQTNGKVHTYQELSETASRRTSILSRASTRMSTVSAISIPPPVLENPHVAQFPYVEIESQPTASLPVAYAQPVGRKASFPYVEPATLVVSEKTGTQARKLFHALDEEGFHVPTAEERDQYEGTSTNDIYSKLSRPSTRNRDSRDTIFFEQADLYWEPPTSASELYNQLAMRKYREIQRDQIRVKGCLGSGHFGTVHKGMWHVPGGFVDVAVKTLKADASEDDEVKFLREAAIMGQFLHPNVVKMHGVVTVGKPLMIVLELMPKGDLKAFLRSFHKKSVSIRADLPSTFLKFCRQIAVGMNYLANKAFVHRDLAARNIFLTEDLTCKIGDFGMARDLADDNVYHSQGGKIPLKWTAPEALNYRKFSSASDVWSFGMVVFEIWSLGRKPFDRVQTAQLMSLLNVGHCQPPPPGCPRAVYQLMVQCWHPMSSKRPSFSEICDYLNASDDLLLHWTSQDKMVSERVMEVGAPHSEARNLYPDLQYTYDTS